MATMERTSDTVVPGPAVVGATVVPRWEWRAFERTFAAPPPVEGATGSQVAGEREETYLLSLLSPHNVKIRDGQLEIKRLVRADASGLEQWCPLLKRPFPIGVDALTAACEAWGLPAPADGRPIRSLAELLQTVVVPHRQLRIVTMAKRRIPVTVAGCHGERGQITVAGHRWNTVSFEDADPARVLAALRELKLDPAANENYPRALKRILGLPDHSSVPPKEARC